MESAARFRHFEATPLSGSLGAEITELDLRETISGDVAKEIIAAFTRYHMLCFRDQKLGLDDYRRVARLFGPFSGNPIHVGLPTHPEFVRVVKEANQDGPTFGGNWHTDLSFFATQPKATILYAEEVPTY